MTEVGFTHYHTVEETRRHSVGKVMELTEMKVYVGGLSHNFDLPNTYRKIVSCSTLVLI